MDKLAFYFDHKGYRITATHLDEPKGEASIEIEKDGTSLKTFQWPSYKIWNIPAHIDNIIEGLERESDSGLRIAGSDGLGGNVYRGDE